MSACLKMDPSLDSYLDELTDSSALPKHEIPEERRNLKSFLLHVVVLLGILGLCAFLSVVGLLWFSLAIEPG